MHMLNVEYSSYTSICLARIQKITTNLSKRNRSPYRDSSPGSPKYETGMLTITPGRTVAEFQDQRLGDKPMAIRNLIVSTFD
jgi:hypothetical protein